MTVFEVLTVLTFVISTMTMLMVVDDKVVGVPNRRMRVRVRMGLPGLYAVVFVFVMLVVAMRMAVNDLGMLVHQDHRIVARPQAGSQGGKDRNAGRQPQAGSLDAQPGAQLPGHGIKNQPAAMGDGELRREECGSVSGR